MGKDSLVHRLARASSQSDLESVRDTITALIAEAHAQQKHSHASRLKEVLSDNRLSVDRRKKDSASTMLPENMESLTVLMEFAGKNQIASETEELRFALSTEVKDKGSAALNGVPIFLGVSVGQDGIAFEGRTINVKSNVDDALIKALRGETFQRGLSLLTSAQPALKPFVGLATNVVNSVVSRSQNRQIHSFKLGLDFGSGSTSARLREGSYIVVQADVATWDWSEVVCNSNSQALLYKSTKKPIEFNYLIFGVATFAG